MSVNDASLSRPIDNTAQPGSARERSRELTRSRLKASATELFATRGLRNLTTHDIARGAGVAAGTFYLHFKDKQVLLREIVLEALATLHEEMDLAADGCCGHAQARARIETVVDFAERRGEIIRILFSHDNEWGELQTHVLNELAEIGEQLIRAQQADGVIRPDVNPGVTAQAITGMQARVIDWWTQDPSRASRTEIIETLFNLQLTGVYGPGTETE